MKYYQKLIIVIASVLMVFPLVAQNNGIHYKAVIKDNNGNVIANQSVTIQFSILKGIGLNNVFSENHTPTADAFGIIAIAIGEGSIISGDYPSIDWGSDDHFLNVQIDIGSGLVDMGTTGFKAVPYALHAANAASKINDLIDGKSDNDGTVNGSSIFLGLNAGLNDDSSDNKNVGIGYLALSANSSGEQNVAIGFQALTNNTGFGNTAIGTSTLISNTGSENVAFGNLALFNNTEGGSNTANGASALFNNISGNQNTAYGYQSGYSNILGSRNIFIGFNSGYFETSSDKLYIENSIADGDNALIYGEFDTNILRTNSVFQIGNPALTGFAFPPADGTNTQILQTDGNGALTWVANSTSGTSGLEAIDEGFGAGWRLIGRDPANYGPIGSGAIDFSNSDDLSSTNGATGLFSFAMGDNVEASNLFSTAFGFGTIASGNYAFAVGTGTTASANGAVAMGGNNVASANYATALGFNTIASGNWATALGHNTIAEGWNSTAAGVASSATGTQSTAIGGGNEASGHSAVALGNATIASGQNSTAFGTNTLASGAFATAMSAETKAESFMSTAIGRFNIGGGAPTSWVGSDPLFEIGNGDNNANRTNALTVLKNGSIVAPSFEIAEITDPKALITKEYADAIAGGGGNATGLETLNEGNGTGWRLIGADPANFGTIGSSAIDLSTSTSASSTAGATGQSSHATGLGTQASGIYGTAMGFSTEATGDFSVALGSQSEASGGISTAMGFSSTASGYTSLALGYNVIASNDHTIALGKDTNAGGLNATAIGTSTTANGNYATAMGSNTIASGIISTAMGNLTTASGLYATSMGTNTTASGQFSTAMGVGTIADGSYSTAFGSSTNALGDYSVSFGSSTIALGDYTATFGQLTEANALNTVAMGIGTLAQNENSLVVGEFNDPGTQTTVLFQVGNGTGNGIDPGTFRANAMTVYRNGSMHIAGSLTQNSDERLKANIVDLKYGLKDLLKLNPVAYNWKRFPQKTDKSLGLIAQEVQSVIKEIVHVNNDKDQTLSVSYIELIPVLINAIKEQNQIIKSQGDALKTSQINYESLQNNYESLASRMEQLEAKQSN